VESELAWIRSLGATDDVRVPSVIPATDGSAVVEVGGRLAVFFTWIEGESPSTVWDIAAIAFELGQLASRLHRHSKTWVRPWWFRRFAWDLEAAYGQHPRWGSWKLHPDLDEEAVKVLGPLQATVERNLSQSGVKPLLIHADLRATNLVVGDNGLLHVIDFDDCGFAWPMYDLATAFSFEEDNEAVPELIKTWLDGYGAEPSRELLSHVWTLIAYRRLLLLGWLATHPMADANLDFGASFAFRTVAFADRVMSHINLRGSPGSNHIKGVGT
jgi:Ser/Thr protein kinase RdoA (MazF antagonist)